MSKTPRTDVPPKNFGNDEISRRLRNIDQYDHDIQYKFRKMCREISNLKTKASRAHDHMIAEKTRASDMKHKLRTALGEIKAYRQLETELNEALEVLSRVVPSLRAACAYPETIDCNTDWIKECEQAQVILAKHERPDFMGEKC